MIDSTQSGRQLLSAASRSAKRADEQDDDLAPLPRHAEPGKTTRLVAPGDEAATPPTRAATTPRIDRRAEVDAAVDDGALASAFDLIQGASHGPSLPDHLARRFAAQLGVDVARLRIHTDASAAAAAATLNARAFTIGNDIYFADGAYDPDSEAGVRLIAHEMVHVAENQRGIAPTSSPVSQPGDHHERRADEFADRFSSRRTTIETSDPAEMVEHVRAFGQRIPLPYAAELEEHFGTSFDFVEAYTGEAAELACRLMAASAFAVRSVVALADPSAQRDTLMHELTHVMQMGGRSAIAPSRFATGSLGIGAAESAAEHEAERHAATPTVSADRSTIHRTTKPPAAGGKVEPAKVAKFCEGQAAKDADKSKLKWGFKSGATATHRYYSASGVFSADELKKAGATDDFIKEALGASGVMKGVKGFLLHEAPGGYIVSRTGQKPPVEWKSPVVETKPYGKKWKDDLEVVEELKVKFTWGDGDALDQTDPPTSNTEAKTLRGVMRTAVATKYAKEKPPFATFYAKVVNSTGKKFDNKTTGSIFEELVALVAVAEGNKQATKAIPVWDSKDKAATQDLQDALSGMGKSRLDGDGVVAKTKGNFITLSEAKAYVEGAGPTGGDIKKMGQYKLLMDDGHEGYYSDNGTVTRVKLGHVAYTIAAPKPGPDGKFDKTKTQAEATLTKWMEALADAFDGGSAPKKNPGKGKYSADKWSLSPPPTGEYKFKVKFNPELEFTVPSGTTQINLDNPMVEVPGLKVSSIRATVDDKHVVKSGTVTYGVDAGDIKKAPAAKPLTSDPAGGGGQVDNKLTGLTSKLKDFLPVDIDAAIVDDGVEATIKLKQGQKVPSLGGFTLDGDVSEIKATYKGGGTLAINATVGLKHKNGKIKGLVSVSYDNGWAFEGTLKIDEGLIPGVKGLEATVSKSANGEWKVGADEFKIEKQFGAIKLTGTGTDLEYNITTEQFKGDLELDADLGAFGKAKGKAKIERNKLTKGSLSYDSPELKYPPKAAEPAITGTVGGTLTFNDGKFSGNITGTANLNAKGLKKLAPEGVGLAVDVNVEHDGTYSGSIKSTKPIQLGKHIKVSEVGCTFAKDGSLTGNFSVEIVNIKNLKTAKATGTVDASGVHITDAEATVEFGDKDKGKFWGSITAKYNDEKGFDVEGTANYKIKDDIIATGTIKYSQETNAIGVELKVTEITLFDKKISKQLFSASKQIPVVNIYGLGIYIDIGLDLGFDFGFKLTMTPSAKVEDFSLDTMEYKRIAAKLEVGGDIYAQLTGTPKLGIGVFAIDPSIIRGGGGLKVPIVGRLDVKPKATFDVGYSPSGGADASAKLGISGEFGIKGSVKPYAEFALLNNLWNPKWEGEALAEFEILKPTELFNFTVDLNSKEKQEDPALPGKNETKAPTEPEGDQKAKAAPKDPVERGGGAGKTDAKQGEVAEGGDQGPFSLDALMEKLKAIPGFATAKKIFEYGQKIWKVVKPVWDLFEPLMDIIVKRIEEVIDLFDPAPSMDNIGEFLWKLAKLLFNLSFGGLSEIASAIKSLLGKAAAFAKKLINKAVQDGHLGVKRHSYYIWMPWPKDDIEFMAAAEWKINIPGVGNLGQHGPPGFLLRPTGVVSLVLYEALQAVGIGYTYVGNSDINRPYNDIWTGAGARG